MSKWLETKFDVAFAILVLIELTFVIYFPEGRIVSKPLIMIALLSYYYWKSKRRDWLFITALIFAFLGDTFLLSDEMFLFGLGSFLVMQLLYTVCFFKQRGSLIRAKLLGLLAVIISTVAVLLQIIPDVGAELKIPVIIYTSAIALMALSAIARAHEDDHHYWLILMGVVAFLISDSILGINKFGGGFELAGLIVMSTYILAQWLIVKGYLNYEASNNDAL